MPWDLTGNTSINPTTNFLGTRDNQPLAIRTNQYREGPRHPYWQRRHRYNTTGCEARD